MVKLNNKTNKSEMLENFKQSRNYIFNVSVKRQHESSYEALLVLRSFQDKNFRFICLFPSFLCSSCQLSDRTSNQLIQ